MDQDTAKLIFTIIMGAGIAAWLIALWQALRLGRAAPSSNPEQFSPDTDLPFTDDHCREERANIPLRGDPDELSQAFVRSLRQSAFGQVESIYQIKRHPDSRVVLKKNGPLICNLPPHLYFTEAEVAFRRTGADSTEVEYRLGFDRLLRLVRKVALLILLAIGLPVLVIVGTVIWLFVIPSPILALRWQVVQTVQIIHALWPPYLFMSFYWLGRVRSRTWIENLITNLDADL